MVRFAGADVAFFIPTLQMTSVRNMDWEYQAELSLSIAGRISIDDQIVRILDVNALRVGNRIGVAPPAACVNISLRRMRLGLPLEAAENKVALALSDEMDLVQQVLDAENPPEVGDSCLVWIMLIMESSIGRASKDFGVELVPESQAFLSAWQDPGLWLTLLRKRMTRGRYIKEVQRIAESERRRLLVASRT